MKQNRNYWKIHYGISTGPKQILMLASFAKSQKQEGLLSILMEFFMTWKPVNNNAERPDGTDEG